jgi:hypothetical protein
MHLPPTAAANQRQDFVSAEAGPWSECQPGLSEWADYTDRESGDDPISDSGKTRRRKTSGVGQ